MLDGSESKEETQVAKQRPGSPQAKEAATSSSVTNVWEVSVSWDASFLRRG